MTQNTLFEISELARKLENLIRLGKVVMIDAEHSRVTIQIGKLTTKPLPWLEHAAGATRTRRVPSIGEQVIVLSMSGDFNNGIVLAGLNYNNFPSLQSDADEEQHVFSDGTLLAYNTTTQVLNVTTPGTLTLQAQSVVMQADLTVRASKMTFIGDIEIQGYVHVSGNLIADGQNSNHHSH